MGFCNNVAFNSTMAGLDHIYQHNIEKLEERNGVLASEVSAIEDEMERAIDNVKYAYDFDGDGEADSITGMNFEIEEIKKENEKKIASRHCEETVNDKQINFLQNAIAFVEKSEDVGEKMQSDSANSFKYFGGGNTVS